MNGWTISPAPRDVTRSLYWAALLTVLFPAVYMTCNWITEQRASTLRLWFDWELSIPFVPAMVWIYLSLFIAFFLPMFALRGAALNALCRRLLFALLVSAVVFLLVPARLGFERTDEVPRYADIFSLIYLFDLPGNTFPSLHVSWSALFLGSLHDVSGPRVRRLLEVWFVALCVSVLLVHQHHVVDIAGGLLVRWLARVAVTEDGQWAWLKGRPA
jgi:membrane-associated phospholipid phosphatase